MSTLLALLFLGLGFGTGLAYSRLRDPHRRAFNPDERRRIEALRALVKADPDDEDPAPRVELAEHFLERGDPKTALGELGDVVRDHGDRERVRGVARRVLRGLLLHELEELRGLPGRLLPQDIDFHPETRRVVLRLKDLNLGGLLEIQHLELHIENFDPGHVVQSLPRVVGTRAVLREERLAHALSTRVDWSRSPISGLRVRFRRGRAEVRGSYRAPLGVPIGFRVSTTVRIVGSSRIEVAFPDRPLVGGLMPLPIDTLIKAVVGVLDAKLPGAVTSREEATLTLDLLRLGLPPVEVNLDRITVEDGRFEVLCRAPEVSSVPGGRPETPELVVEPLPEEGEELEAPEEPGEEAPGRGMLQTLYGFLGGDRSPVERALARARRRREKGDDEDALELLEAVEEKLDLSREPDMQAVEELAALRLDLARPGSRHRAEGALDRLLERDPGRARASYLRARVDELAGLPEAAEDRVGIACRLDPFLPEPLRMLARLQEERGARRAAARTREVLAFLQPGPLPDPPPGSPDEPRGMLPGHRLSELEHPREQGPTGRLIRNLQGSLGWLDPAPDPRRSEGEFWPVSEDDYPRLMRINRDVSRALQASSAQVVLRRVRGPAPLRVRGAWKPWIEIGDLTLPRLDERTLTFELARVLHHTRTGQGFLLGLGEEELELLYALLRVLAEEAHRNLRGRTGEAQGGVERAVHEMADSIQYGWVLGAEDLDPWVRPEIRAGVEKEALAFRDQQCSYRDLLDWQWGLEASADRAGLLFSGSPTAGLRALRLVPSELWLPAEEEGLAVMREHVREDRVAFRAAELLRYAVDPRLEELERELFS